MKFGTVENIDDVDFTLPEDHADTDKLLKSLKKTKSRGKVYVGCAKWGIKEWIGTLYPKGTREDDFRKLYLKEFNCIELNPTHYRIHKSEVVKQWKEGADKDFRFFPKFHQGISHFKRLKGAEELTEIFFKSVNNLGNNLGCCFLQMPPNFAPKSFDVLKDYLEKLPSKPDVQLELRHPGWYSDKNIHDELYSLLKKNKIGFVITDAAGRRDMVHMRLSTPDAYIRFVGNSLHPTDYKRIDDWIKRISQWLESGVRCVYFTMHMHDEKDSPELCRYLVQNLNKQCDLKLHVPKLFSQKIVSG